jgi:ribosomal protein S18 acetylase RimI-like enzyme
LVPADPGLPSDSFVAGNYYKEDWEKTGVKAAKMVVSAVSSKTNKGWYRKIISEMAHHFKNIGIEYIFMNTQSTNRAVLHTLQDLGFKVVSTTHILSYNN